MGKKRIALSIRKKNFIERFHRVMKIGGGTYNLKSMSESEAEKKIA